MKKLPQFLIFIIIIFLPIFRILVVMYQNQSWLQLNAWLPLLSWLISCMAGFLALQMDQILDIFITNPDSNLAKAVKNYLKQKHISYGLNLLENNKHLQPRLSFRSVTFQIIWIMLIIFTFTSTVSSFGKGFVMGLGTRLLIEQWGFYFSNRNLLKNWLFWQIKREINDQELKWYLIIVTFLLIIMDITIKI